MPPINVPIDEPIEKASGQIISRFDVIRNTTPYNSPTNTNLIERFHSTLKQRTKVMRGLKDIESAKLIMRAWLVHYNYFRPHEGLNNKTPAEKAGVTQSPKNWADIVVVPKVKLTSKARPLIIHDYPRISSRMPRITPRMPRITPARPSLPKGDIYVGRGMYSRHPFRGAKAIRGRLLR